MIAGVQDGGADNRGEGGILALMALSVPDRTDRGRISRLLLALGIFGAALLYGDGIITPSMTVLSAIEGLNVATKVFEPLVVPLTVAILIALFFVLPYLWTVGSSLTRYPKRSSTVCVILRRITRPSGRCVSPRPNKNTLRSSTFEEEQRRPMRQVNLIEFLRNLYICPA